MSDLALEERFWSKVHKTDGCWLWTDKPNSRGYGTFWVASVGSKMLAHRFAYELMVCTIPAGLTIDHVKDNGCTSKLCVKAIADEYSPAHLEPVTNKVNQLRGNGIGGVNARKTHCIRGHEFTGKDLYITRRGTRMCRRCQTDRQREKRRFQREAV